MPAVFFELLLAHLLGDFVFQSNDLIVRKYKSWRGTFEHVCIITFFAVLFLFPYWGQSLTWKVLGLIFISHFVQDFLKIHLDRHYNSKKKSTGPFFADQILHIGLIAWLSSSFTNVEMMALPQWVHNLYSSPFLVLYLIGLVFFSYTVEITKYQFYRQKTQEPKPFKADHGQMRKRVMHFSMAYVLFLLVNGSFV